MPNPTRIEINCATGVESIIELTDEEVADTISRNVEHLEIMVAKDFWTNENMTKINAAIKG